MKRKSSTLSVLTFLIVSIVFITVIGDVNAQDPFMDSFHRGWGMADQLERTRIERERLEMQKRHHEMELERQRLELQQKEMEIERQKRDMELQRRADEALQTVDLQNVKPCEANCIKMYINGVLKQGVNIKDCIKSICSE